MPSSEARVARFGTAKELVRALLSETSPLILYRSTQIIFVSLIDIFSIPLLTSFFITLLYFMTIIIMQTLLINLIIYNKKHYFLQF